jgi:multidrug efflux system membrane fusion protein
MMQDLRQGSLGFLTRSFEGTMRWIQETNKHPVEGAPMSDVSSEKKRQILTTTVLLAGCLGFALISGGCAKAPAQVAPAESPVIPVSQPVRRDVTEYEDFTGRTAAVESVDIRPRATGYIVKIPFQEGADVKAGDVLFEIDPRPYQAQLDQATGQVALYQAQLKLAKLNYARDLAINSRVPTSVSQQTLDSDFATVEEADARVKAYEKNREAYQLNLEFTQVRSPITGHVSSYYLKLGNLVNQDQTLLTTVVSLDPMQCYFDMDEPSLLRIRRAINDGRIKSARASGSAIPVLMGLQGEDGFPHHGTVDFIDNQVNPTTGSISVRGVFPNPKPKDGVRVLSPGMFGRIRLPIGSPRSSLLVIDRAVGSDQGLKYVYVVDDKNVVQYRRVTTGPLQEDGLRVIEQGLEPSDWVVIGGIQQVRPRMHVEPERTPMPGVDQPTAAPAKPSTDTSKPATEPAKPASTPAAKTKN